MRDVDTSSGTDQVKFVYNVDGSRTQQTDQRGTVLDYTYTNVRKLELTKVTTLGGSTDGHVRSIKRSYDDMARLEKLTSYSNSDGTGTVRSEIQYEYNDLDQVSTSYQSHEAAVITASTPKVQYAYDATVSTNVFTRQHRLEKVTYPDGRVIFHDYDTANADYPSNRLSRVRKLRETSSTGTELAIYDYNGRNRLALADLPEPDIKLDLYQGTGGTYAGLDRFGRVQDQYWDGYGTTADVDRFKYDYDDDGSRTYRDIDSAIYSTNDKDQAYTYDGLHRLKTSDEGTLSGSTISGTPDQEEDWTLDALGNWSGYVTKTSGTTDLNQSRTNNDVNEITNITETTGPAWVTPAHDAAGNMTTIPKPADLTAGYTATYDAWNRLVKLEDGANTVAEYEYDGLNRRIVKSIYSGGSLDHRRRVYYNRNWQVLEVRKEVSGTEDTDPLEQYVWHPYYVDALLLRDYDADVDGTSERHYYTQDANFNVTAVTDDSGTVLERYHYTPYGQLHVLDADFSDDADSVSDIDNTVTYTGRRYDDETGLYQFRNRYFQTELGTFVGRDPIRYVGTDWNLYEYTSSNAVSSVDPMGLRRRPRSRKKCCDAFKTKFGWPTDPDGVIAALVICCDGKKRYCLRDETVPPKDDVVARAKRHCATEHEKSHFLDTPVCPEKCPHVSDALRPRPGVTTKKTECDAYRKELKCLEGYKDRCDEDGEPGTCERRLDNVISIVRGFANGRYDCGFKKPEPPNR